MNDESDHRQRLYTNYVSSGASGHAGRGIESLKPRLPYLTMLVRNHFPASRESVIVDLGCGHGALLYAVRNAGYSRLTGIDGSLEQIEVAHRLGIHEARCADLFEYLRSLDAASVDVVVAFDVIEHFAKSELLYLVDEVHRVLKPGGRWIIHAPNGESPFFGRIRYGDFTHELAFTQSSIGALLRSSGFEFIQCYEDNPVVHGIKSAVRLCLWKCIRLLLKAYLLVETGSSAGAIFSQNFLCVARKPGGV